MTRATNVEQKKLLSLGVCFGKFTKTGKFRLHITALDYLAPYAKVSWIRSKKLNQTIPYKDQWYNIDILYVFNVLYCIVQGLGQAIR